MHLIIDQKFRDIVRKELESRGWSQADLARAMGVSRAMVFQYLKEVEPRSPGSDVIEKFFAALELDVVFGATPHSTNPKRKKLTIA